MFPLTMNQVLPLPRHPRHGSYQLRRSPGAPGGGAAVLLIGPVGLRALLVVGVRAVVALAGGDGGVAGSAGGGARAAGGAGDDLGIAGRGEKSNVQIKIIM